MRWDLSAERYSAAVTLYEMSAGYGVLPCWGDGKSVPSVTDCELVIDAEKFDASVREGLVEFFHTALHREPKKRFDNAEEMKWAWQQVFKEAEQRKVRTPSGEAIARFRLIVAALRACGITRLKDSPAWNIHLATGDSLLFGRRWDREGKAKNEQKFFETEVEGNWAPEIYACEDRRAINEVLGRQYHVVVGNPPYITPKDKALNQAYRDRYSTCHRQYSLAVPFMERFFDLAVGGGTTTKETKDTKGEEKQRAGYVGQITANSFMKREFGKKLIEEYFAKVDLTHVLDTSGAYIPGHGTPTVILFGRNRRPVSETVRAVLGIKGEPSTPADPSQGLVWQSVIKLPVDATEDDHLALLGLLNSSTACFWMQQTFHNKGGPGGGSSKDDKWHDFYEFSGTGLQRFPVPENKPNSLSHAIDQLAQQNSTVLPEQWITAEVIPTRERLAESQQQATLLRQQMIALQEELDWECYELYGLINHETHEKEQPIFYEDLFRVFRDFRGCSLGQRAFEIVMARHMSRGELQTKWFSWLRITPQTEIPADWPKDYRNLVERRIQLIETNKEIGLIERPDCKRRWESESWENQQQRALRNWLLDRLEARFNFQCSVFGEEQPTAENRKPKTENQGFELITVAQLADRMAADSDFLQVAAIYRGREDFDVAALVAELVASESVPFLPVLRYKPAGLRKREVWERVWEMQREEDRRSSLVYGHSSLENNPNDQEPMTIPVPPKYSSADFLKSDFWRMRGKLDVPKERWISFPHCETESDPSLVVGWAGWNHLQQDTALIAYYDARKREGWDAKRLTPLLAGLDQLLPWIHQWHPEVDPQFGETAGQSFETMLKADAHELGLTLEDIRAWEPPAKKKGSKPRKTRNTRKKKAAKEGNHE